jgi:ubiquitin-activating enzyme E1
LRKEDIGKPRAAATLPRLAELNAYVPVRDLGGKAGEEITADLIRGFHVRNAIESKLLRILTRYVQVVVLCGVTYKKQLEINDWTHENGVHFITAETRGLFG